MLGVRDHFMCLKPLQTLKSIGTPTPRDSVDLPIFSSLFPTTSSSRASSPSTWYVLVFMHFSLHSTNTSFPSDSGLPDPGLLLLGSYVRYVRLSNLQFLIPR